jgi:hypothetical protein
MLEGGEQLQLESPAQELRVARMAREYCGS